MVKSAARRVYEHVDIMHQIAREIPKANLRQIMTLEKSFLPLAIHHLWPKKVSYHVYRAWDPSTVWVTDSIVPRVSAHR